MKDVSRDELELRLYNITMNIHGGLPALVIDVINDALHYVQNNPSIRLVANATEELERSVIETGKVYEESSSAHADIEAYDEERNKLDAYRETVLIMEELA